MAQNVGETFKIYYNYVEYMLHIWMVRGTRRPSLLRNMRQEKIQRTFYECILSALLSF